MARITKGLLEQTFLGKQVSVVLFDGDVLTGVLHKTGEEIFKHDPNLYIPKNRYFVSDDNKNVKGCIFRVSHIKKINIVRE
ncbi:hypothetical protein LJC51_07455 [Lachnospiraceae bacterium OttesenSCG-928-J05]|nr:hypothetical protein [Lachnospiraceae bacterium OttesenSCG-928-J05]